MIFIINGNNNKIITDGFNFSSSRYLYYLLLNNNDLINNSYNGTAQKVISKTNLKLIKIPIINISKQKSIIEFNEKKENDNKKLLEKINENNQEIINYMNDILKNEKNVEEDSIDEKIIKMKKNKTMEV